MGRLSQIIQAGEGLYKEKEEARETESEDM